MASQTNSKYAHLTREQVERLLEKYQHARKLGLVWERDELEADSNVNTDFVALELLPQHSVGIAPYQNLLIEGDNYDVLRYLNIAYRGRVKCIYIDPPYNTGNDDFIYNDKFINKEHRYRHSTWLEFMHRRLTLARDLLSEDGVIFVSISEHEHARLELLMDEVFAGMKVGNFIWRTRSGANDEKDWFVSVDHEYVLCYANSGFSFEGDTKALLNYSNPDNDERGDWTSGDLGQGKTWLQRPDGFYEIYNSESNIWYACDSGAVWRFARKSRSDGKKLRSMTIEELIADHRIEWKLEPNPAFYESETELLNAIKSGTAPPNLRVYLQLAELERQVEAGEAPRKLLENIPPLSFWVGKKIGYTKPRLKRFASELKRTEKPVSTWLLPAAIKKNDAESLEGVESVKVMISGYTSEGTSLLKDMIGNKDFAFPKPLSLIKALLKQATDPHGENIVLDFFAGSGTTGQAVMELNAEDQGDRRFLLVSTAEATAKTPDKNVCRDITAKRLKAAIQGYTVPTKTGNKTIDGIDGEFGYLKSARIAMEVLHSQIRHDQIWLALQQMHNLGLIGFTQGELLHRLEDENQRLVYVPAVSQPAVSALQQLVSQLAKSTVVYSGAPSLLEQRVFSEQISFLPVPEVLLERFGGGVGGGA
jgi:adenine-specific DNA-methyltransferase